MQEARHSIRPAGLHQHPLPDQLSISARSDINDFPANIGALNPRETKFLPSPAGVFSVAVAFGLPTYACIDIGVVDARRPNLYQDL